MKPAEERLAPLLDRTPFADLEAPLYHNVDARKVTKGAEAREGLKRQVSRSVRWVEIVEKMIADEGIDTFVEVGSGAVLSGLIRRINRNVKRLNIEDCTTLDSVRSTLAG
jgi:[acyl-carrier-protein] S-malonyltransferase